MNSTNYSKDEYARRLFQFQTKLRTSLYDVGSVLPNAQEHPYLYRNRVCKDYCFDCVAARRIIDAYVKRVSPSEEDYSQAATLAQVELILKQLIHVQIACKADGGGIGEE